MTTPYDAAAESLLSGAAAKLPDLSRCTVLMPYLHAAAPLLAALRPRIPMPVFLPPRLTTLNGLAAGQASDEEAEADCLRLAEIRDFLAKAGICDERLLWTAAEELLALMGEFSAWRLSPTDDTVDFLHRVQTAYGGRMTRPLEREAGLVLELWHAMQMGRRRDAMGDYAARLARAARSAQGPLYTLGLSDLTPLEEDFLEQWGQMQEVRHLPFPPVFPERQTFVATAWTRIGESPKLMDRASGLSATLPKSPLTETLRLYPASSLEDEAATAARQVSLWVAAGLRHIAIVALDRLTARRLRALLERDRILVRDETGWTLSTVSVAHVLDRLFSLVTEDCYHQDLLDLFKSPFVFADLDRDDRLTAVAELEQALRAEGLVEGWSSVRTLIGERVPAARTLFARLEQATSRLHARRRTLAAWQSGLLAALDDLGAREAFRADGAGRQLLALLETMERQVGGHGRPYALSDWREWLARQLERTTFQDEDIDSPIRLVSPASARMRTLDAAILLGADADHLPPGNGGRLFNDRVREALGLPVMRHDHDRLRAAVSDLLCHVPRLLVTWQSQREGEPNPVSPWLELLEGMHRLAYGTGLASGPVASQPPHVHGSSPLQAPAPRPAWIPGHLSASGWQSLVQCPYQFFARRILGLAELEAVPEEMEKRDYGELVHEILRRFHTDHPRLGNHPRSQLVDALNDLTLEVFAPCRSERYLSLAWKLRWESHIPDYVDWALGWEQTDHVWRECEADLVRDMPLPEGGSVTLKGRLDRLDDAPDGRVVLDYKTQPRQTLRSRMRAPGEAVQLPFYGLLSGAVRAAYVTLDDTRVDTLVPEGGLAPLVEEEGRRIQSVLGRIAAGAPLPAQGSESTCGHCEMRGLCRRDHWSRMCG